MSSSSEFLQARLRTVDKAVHRLGLTFNFGIDAAGVEAGLERGINYLFWTSMRTGKALPAVKAALKRDRDRYVLAAGPTLGFFRGNIRRGTEKLLRKLDVDYIDVLHLFWLGRTSALTEGNIEELQALREEGKVRALGVSIHDRPRAGRLAEDSVLDLFMIRYNAAHPGAEKDIFPHLEKRHPNVVAYTATRWRKLLSAPRGWSGPVMTAGDCYRFCLSSPHVDVVLCGPKNAAQLQENLDALEKGPLTDDEEEWMRRFGKAVHG
jgi:aryl-alcohol dehydrogenase-like predicted oxidoreductase